MYPHQERLYISLQLRFGKEMNDTTLEVRLALEALGYSSKEIHTALQDIDTNNKTTSTIIKEALHQLQ